MCVQQTAAAWRNVFYIAAAIYLFGTIFYAIFGSGRRQSWGKPPASSTEDQDQSTTGAT